MNNRFNYKESQRFSLRKLSVGLCSVCLGCLFLQMTNTEQVDAAELNGENPAAVETTVEKGKMENDTAASDTTKLDTTTSTPTKVDDEKVQTKQVQAASPASESSASTSEAKSKLDSLVNDYDKYFNDHYYDENSQKDAKAKLDEAIKNAKDLSSKEGTTDSALQFAYDKIKDAESIFDSQKKVTESNLNDYFDRKGNSEKYKDTDKDGNVTLTGENDSFANGEITLKDKIDMDSSFNLDGEIQLRNPDADPNKQSADGIGIAFHPGDPSDLGIAGGNLGIGGLPGAIGFKFDTFYNGQGDAAPHNSSTNKIADWKQGIDDTGKGHGLDKDYSKDFAPSDADQYGSGNADIEAKFNNLDKEHGYGAFVHTPDIDSPDIVNGKKRYYAHLDGKGQVIKIGGKHRFTINYDGKKHVLTVNYWNDNKNEDPLKWTKKIENPQQSMALVITGSTGYYFDKQLVKINEFRYKAAADGKVIYVDDTEGKELSEHSLSGKIGDTFESTGYYSENKDKIKDYRNQGYILDKDGFSTAITNGETFKAKDSNKLFVYLKHGTVTIDPTDPKRPTPEPNTPINSKDPRPKDKQPKYPSADNWQKQQQSTVHFEDEKETKLSGDKTQTSTWTRKIIVDKVTGEITNHDEGWSSSDAYNDVDVPVIDGYVASKKSKGKRNVSAKVSAGDVVEQDIEDTVVYHKVGKIIPIDKNGDPIPDVDQPIYENDPDDPTKVKTDEKTPEIDGWEPKAKSVTPKDPTKDTEVVYVKKATGDIIYIDDTTNTQLNSDKFSGHVGEKINYKTSDKINDYENQGYVLGSNNFKDNSATFVDGKNHFEVHFKHGVVTIDENNPGSPDDPINKKNPNGPKYPKDSDKVSKDITRTITYIDSEGNKVKTFTQKAHLNAKGTLDKVTGDWIDNLTWVSDKNEFASVNAPIVNGEHISNIENNKKLYKVDKNGNVDSYKIDENSKSGSVVVRYAKNGTEIKNGQQIASSLKVKYVDDKGNELRKSDDQEFQFMYSGDIYDSFNNDKIKVGSWNEESHQFNSVKIPVIKGYIAVEGYSSKDDGKIADIEFTATRENPNKKVTIVYKKIGKITPVDSDHNPIPNAPTPKYKNNPDDPTKVITTDTPIIPDYDLKDPDQKTINPKDPTQNMEVVYLQKVSGTVKYIDDKTGETLGEVIDLPNGHVGDEISYSPADQISSYKKQGYTVVSNDFDNKQFLKKNGNDFEIHLTHDTVTIDPKNPPKSEDKINPEDPRPKNKQSHYPSKDKWTKDYNLTIHFKDEDGKQISKDIKLFSTWTRKITVDKVTGEIIDKEDWKTNKETYDKVDIPKLDDYVAKNTSKDGYSIKNGILVGRKVIKNNIEDTVVYRKQVKGSVIYIDDTTKNELSNYTHTLKGCVGDNVNYSTAETILKLKDLGYKYVSGEFSKSEHKFDKDEEKNKFVVHLEHDKEVVIPDKKENTPKPGDKIDEHHDTKYPNEVSYEKLTKEVTRTIHYQDEEGNELGHEDQVVKFERHAIVDKVTGELLGYDLNGKHLDKKDADKAWILRPEEFGSFEPITPADPSEMKDENNHSFGSKNKESVDGIDKVDPLKDYQDEYVVYKRMHVKFIDDTQVDNQTDKLKVYNINTPEDGTIEDKINAITKDGKFVLVPYDMTILNKKSGHYEIHFKHAVKDVTEVQTFKRVINYVDEDNNKLDNSLITTITFTGKGVLDVVTGKLVELDKNGNIINNKSQLDWTYTIDGQDAQKGQNAKFSSTDEKSIINKNGVKYLFHHVDKTEFDAGNGAIKEKWVSAKDPYTMLLMMLSENSDPSELVINVVYKKATPTPQPDPEPNPDPDPETPQPDPDPTPDEPLSDNPNDYDVVDDNKLTNSSDKTVDTVKKDSQKQSKVVKKHLSNPTEKKNTVSTNDKVENDEEKPELPQTGENENVWTLILGIFISALAMLGLTDTEKNKK